MDNQWIKFEDQQPHPGVLVFLHYQPFSLPHVFLEGAILQENGKFLMFGRRGRRNNRSQMHPNETRELWWQPVKGFQKLQQVRAQEAVKEQE